MSLLGDLRKLDLSHNKIVKIPSSINNCKKLEKINISDNNIEHLPLSLGNLPSLQVLLATNNPLQLDIEEVTSQKLLDHLRTCYTGSLAVLPCDHISLGNSWTRTRGQVFDSTVLNAGSAQSLFEQQQAQAVQTGNRLLTPLIPPQGATSLQIDKFRDTILGMLYGAAIGDSLGFLTEKLSPDEAEFHYSRRTLDQSHMYRDQFRSEATLGQVTPAIQLTLLMLESIMKWAGVVDELDFAQKLVGWYDDNHNYITSDTLHSLMNNKPLFLKYPQVAAKTVAENNPECKELGTFDNYCLPAIIAIALTQFHNIHEVEANSRRICKSTHFDKKYEDIAASFGSILALILQGNNRVTKYHGLENSSLQAALKYLDCYQERGFRDAMINIILKGGSASLNGLVAGAIFGAMDGYQALPTQWTQQVDKSFITILDKKLNNLLDLMGVP